MTRPTKILVTLAVAVLVGGIVALWAGWGSAALPDDQTLAARIVESAAPDAGAVKPGLGQAFYLWKGAAPERPIVLNGWEFRLFDPLTGSAKRLPPDSLSLGFLPSEKTPAYSIWAVDLRYQGGRPRPVSAVSATPVSPMAKLRFWFGAYPDPWGTNPYLARLRTEH